MAARVFFQGRAAAPIMASLLVGGPVLYPAVAHAEEPEDSQRRRKPIYDDVETSSTTSATLAPAKSSPAASSSSTSSQPSSLASSTNSVASSIGVALSSAPSTLAGKNGDGEFLARRPTPTDRLAEKIREARLFVYRQACTAEDAINGAADHAFDLERSFTSTVASLAPSRESGERLMPGAVYVLVAAMAGSILTRRSNVLFRAAAPLALGTAAGWTFVPRTMHNFSDLAWSYEQRVPAVANAHLQAREGAERALRFGRVHAQLGADYLDNKIADARESLEEWTRNGK